MGKREYREIFFAENGYGPYECFFCDVKIEFRSRFDVHHVDGNHDNNDPENLVAAHVHCHRRSFSGHWLGKKRTHPISDETRAKLSVAALRRGGCSPGCTCGKHRCSDEHRAKLSAAQKRFWSLKEGGT